MKNDIQANTELSAGSSSVTHTPTPWRVLYNHDGYEIEARGGGHLMTVAALVGRTSSEVEANAALIVKAVNSHAALLELLEDCGNALTDCESELLEAAMVSMSAADRYTDNRALITKIDSMLKELR